MTQGAPTLDAVRDAASRLSPWISRTPIHIWRGREIEALLGADTEVTLKLELFQQSGTFKARGVMASLLALSPERSRAGVTAMSAGNHAIAVAWAAKQLGLSAKVVMQASANPARVSAARAWGAEVLIAADGPTGFALAEGIAAEEGRTFIHPFEGPLTALGTATLGLELIEQAPSLDAVILAVGGGGLAGGASAAIRLLKPDCVIYGVEPEGADSMHRSFAAGSPQRLEAVRTIADSLGPPMALPYSFGLCRAGLDQLVMVTDAEIVDAMSLLFREMKLAVEPGGAASTAALIHRLKADLKGARVGVVVCGSNIDLKTFSRLLGEASAE